MPVAVSRHATGTGGSSGAASAHTPAATSAADTSSMRWKRVCSARRDVASVDAIQASAAAIAADSRGDAAISTAAAGTSAANNTAEHHSVRTRWLSSTRARNCSGKHENSATADSASGASMFTDPSVDDANQTGTRKNSTLRNRLTDTVAAALRSRLRQRACGSSGRASGSQAPSPAASTHATTRNASALGANVTVWRAKICDTIPSASAMSGVQRLSCARQSTRAGGAGAVGSTGSATVTAGCLPAGRRPSTVAALLRC